jgi:alkanesulfonate monooxygenase SsuD/methylene tetrahydromethanopterin reductase-like flavin-dependent oxidoreductase (luciferase family)
MEFGILVTPGTEADRQVQAAEAAGFGAAFYVDSPMIFGDMFASMATATTTTSRIALATGVTNPLSRSLPITASTFATLNVLAPGRLIMGIGVGYTATLAMGDRRATLKELEDFVRGFQKLLTGEVAESVVGDRELVAKFLNPRPPWVNLEDKVRVFIAASRPKILRIAGAIADGVILGGITQPEIIAACREHLRAGAEEAGRSIDEITIGITPAVYVTDHEPTIEELRPAIGPKVLAPATNFSFMAEQTPDTPEDVVRDLVAARAAYAGGFDGEIDPDDKEKHLRAWSNYMTELKPHQEPLVTKNVLDACSIYGTPEQVLAKIRRLEEAGVGMVIASPLPHMLDQTVQTFGAEIIPAVAV